MVCQVYGNSIAALSNRGDEGVVPLWGARSQTEFQDGYRIPEVVFLLHSSRRRRDFLTEVDCLVVAEFSAKCMPVYALRPRLSQPVAAHSQIYCLIIF
jgi:hypothetical protein